ncbi:hypothetical protein [Larkinella soli]|uniref:hypothetical protein n=1 Tax=Larkinella soli TaxID=1770527 RepID=UPI000FFB29BD|nr:hypothetical protein [Larkinella soli]
MTQNKRPTDYDAFVTLYEKCKREIHKASREDAFEAAQELFFVRYGFYLSVKFDAFIKRYNANSPVKQGATRTLAAARAK